MTDIVIKTVEELKGAPEEYREAVSKLVISHAINELYGAQVFDEPAIAYAPTPYAKWLTCRVAMEEYGHHVRFKQLGTQIGIPEARMMPGGAKKPLSIFEFPLKTWEEFVAICRSRTCCTAPSIRSATSRAPPCRRSAFTRSSARTSPPSS